MTRAVILAAGRGSRLMPLTADRPKGMVGLAGMPLLARQIAVLRGAGIDDIHIVGGYLAERLQVLGCPLIINPAHETTNMVESMISARTLFDGNDDLLLCYGDIVYEARTLDAVRQAIGDVIVTADRNWRALWSARMDDVAADVESFRLRDDGSLAELGQRPRSLDEVEAQYIGLLRFPASVHARLLAFYDALDRTATFDGQPFVKMYMTSFVQRLIDAGWDVRPALIDGGWLEVDTLDDLRRYHELAAGGNLDRLCRISPPPDPRALIGQLLANDETPVAANVCDISELARYVRRCHELAPEVVLALDRLARKIEIVGVLQRSYEAATMKTLAGSELASPEQAGALLAAYLHAYDLTSDARHLNTVLKALAGVLHTPRPALALELDHACAYRLREGGLCHGG